MRVITQATAIPAGLESKVGPRGWAHGWIFLGIPGIGQSVSHPQLGHGIVTEVHNRSVHVQFSKTGEHRVIPVDHDPHAARRIEQMSDDDIYKHLLSHGDGEHFDRGVAELDRRDKAGSEAKAAALYAEHPRTDDDRDRIYKGLTDLGENPEDAWAHAHGTTSDDLRKKAAIAQLRQQGYSGAGFDELARKAFRDDVHRRAIDTENATNGYLTTAEGKRKGVDGWSLFTGPESRARKYASPELREFWDQHGRPTFDDFTGQLLGHHGTGAPRADFLQ